LDQPDVPVWEIRHISSPHSGNLVSNWTVDRGRSYELDKTQTGTASITLQDPHGYFDPTNLSSPFHSLIQPNLRAQISLFNPANKSYTVVYTGFIESWAWTITPEEAMEIVTINLVDGFELLSNTELTPDSATGITGLYGDSNGTACQTRIIGLLGTAGWPDDSGFGFGATNSRWRNINTGNVFLQPTVYNPGSSVLTAIQDVADAEFPGVANVFINKYGALTFYGRYPRFQPSNYPQDVTVWQVADSAFSAVIGAAKIANIEWTIDSSHIYNAVLCYPHGIVTSDLNAQLFTDATSIATYGYRSLTLSDLMVYGQPAGGGSSAQTAQPTTQAGANAVCLYYSQYYVDNYKNAQTRITRLEFHSRPAGDSQTWAFLCGVEIGDLLEVYSNAPGGGGFSHQQPNPPFKFFVEGIHYSVQPLQGSSIVDVTMTLDVSPAAYYDIAPWQ
jgi:hypothetical protein